jgi:hypothetical protein
MNRKTKITPASYFPVNNCCHNWFTGLTAEKGLKKRDIIFLNPAVRGHGGQLFIDALRVKYRLQLKRQFLNKGIKK